MEIYQGLIAFNGQTPPGYNASNNLKKNQFKKMLEDEATDRIEYRKAVEARLSQAVAAVDALALERQRREEEVGGLSTGNECRHYVLHYDMFVESTGTETQNFLHKCRVEATA